VHYIKHLTIAAHITCLSCGAATFAQVLLDHAEEFLKEMNSKEIANKLKAVKLISETVEKDILQSDNKEANVHLLQHLKRDADEKTVTEIFRIASKTADNGKMSVFAAGVLRKLERGLYWCVLILILLLCGTDGLSR